MHEADVCTNLRIASISPPSINICFPIFYGLKKCPAYKVLHAMFLVIHLSGCPRHSLGLLGSTPVPRSHQLHITGCSLTAGAGRGGASTLLPWPGGPLPSSVHTSSSALPSPLLQCCCLRAIFLPLQLKKTKPPSSCYHVTSRHHLTLSPALAALLVVYFLL